MGMDIDITNADVSKLLQDEKLVDEVVKEILEDPEALDDLASKVASEIADNLENDSVIKQKIMDAAMENPDFRKRVVKELVDEIGDD